MMNLGNNAGKIRISLAAFALLAGSLSLGQVPGLAQKGQEAPATTSQPPVSESLKERLEREENEARNSKPGALPGAVFATPTRGNGGEEDGAGGTPGRNGDPGSGGDTSKNAPQVIPDDGYITITGSTGQVDESATALVDFRNYEIGFKNTPTRVTGMIPVRYNITAVKDAFRTVGAARNNIQIKVRYRDTDGPGTTGRVVVNLFRAGIDTGSGGGELVTTFDSNTGVAPAAQVFQTATLNLCPTNAAGKIDFGNYVYWLEVTLTRNDPNAIVNFGSYQLTETETACP